MCVICVSGKGVRQPSEYEIYTMFQNNPHGAGYMVAKGGTVRIEKGFMSAESLLAQLREEKFTNKDVVVYHFRISTQAGVTQEMTQPFPLTSDLSKMGCLTVLKCPCGVAHNGIIQMTTDKKEKRYSDTALFITGYLGDLVKGPKDLDDKKLMAKIGDMIRSKMVLLDGSGKYTTIGEFYDYKGLLVSNYSILPHRKMYSAS